MKHLYKFLMRNANYRYVKDWQVLELFFCQLKVLLTQKHSVVKLWFQDFCYILNDLFSLVPCISVTPVTMNSMQHLKPTLSNLLAQLIIHQQKQMPRCLCIFVSVCHLPGTKTLPVKNLGSLNLNNCSWTLIIIKTSLHQTFQYLESWWRV